MNRQERIAEVKKIAWHVAVRIVPLWTSGAIAGLLWNHGDPFMGLAVGLGGAVAWWKWVGVW